MSVADDDGHAQANNPSFAYASPWLKHSLASINVNARAILIAAANLEIDVHRGRRVVHLPAHTMVQRTSPPAATHPTDNYFITIKSPSSTKSGFYKCDNGTRASLMLSINGVGFIKWLKKLPLLMPLMLIIMWKRNTLPRHCDGNTLKQTSRCRCRHPFSSRGGNPCFLVRIL